MTEEVQDEADEAVVPGLFRVGEEGEGVRPHGGLVGALALDLTSVCVPSRAACRCGAVKAAGEGSGDAAGVAIAVRGERSRATPERRMVT
jgi:hypothetical protein